MKVPSYCRHQAKGMAYVTIHGKEKYLGKFGSEESIKRSERAIAEFLADVPRDDASTIVELCAEYLDHAREYYRKDGELTGELHGIKSVLKKLRRLYGSLDVHQFRPKHLKPLMHAWIEDGVSRGTINRYAGIVKRIFRWAVHNELADVETYQALQTVPELSKGRTKAREATPVGRIDNESIELTLQHCGSVVADMMQIQLLTGMRPGELCRLRPHEITRSSSPWAYRPGGHKTEHRGKRRVIYIGPQAQEVLTKYLFQEKPFQYTATPYRRHIHCACDSAGIPRWSPGRLRHSTGKFIRARYGLEAAQCVLGHSKADVTQIFPVVRRYVVNDDNPQLPVVPKRRQ